VLLDHSSADPSAPFRLDLTVWALRRRSGNAVDTWDGTWYRRALASADATVGISVADVGDAAHPHLVVVADRGDARRAVDADVRADLECMLGLRVDLSAFYRMAADDAVIDPLVARFRGVRPPRFPTVFEALLNAVACQQLSLEAGLSLLNRLTAAYGAPACIDGIPIHAFPTPDDLAGRAPQALRRLGFSVRKAVTIIEISRAVVTGRLDLEGCASRSDEEVVSGLTELGGIGRWSAEYVLLRGLGRLHVFPGDDVGARKNLARWLGVGSLVDYAAVAQTVARWQPFAGMVYFHLLLDGLSAAGALDPARDVRSRSSRAASERT
jgi:DNA-3-methyladenine glycosylase II